MHRVQNGFKGHLKLLATGGAEEIFAVGVAEHVES